MTVTPEMTEAAAAAIHYQDGAAHPWEWDGYDEAYREEYRAKGMNAARAVFAASPPSERERELEAKLADARAANERTRSQVIDHVNKLKQAMSGHAWLMDSGRGSYEWDDKRYQDEFRAASDTLNKALEPLKDIGVDWTDCPTDWAAVQLARASVESLDVELKQARAQLAQMREALKTISRVKAKTNSAVNVKTIFDVRRLADQVLTSTETTTAFVENIKRATLKKAAMAARLAMVNNSDADELTCAICADAVRNLGGE